MRITQAEKGRAAALADVERLTAHAATKDAQVADLLARLAACEAAGDALRKEVMSARVWLSR